MIRRPSYLYIIILALVCYFILNSFSLNKAFDKINTLEELGKQLFFDPILSKDKTISCASCHKPEFAFADTTQYSKGVHGITARNTPTVMNVTARPYLFWDGRVNSLEEQVWGPVENNNEMSLSKNEVIKRLTESTLYSILFKKICKELPNEKNIGAAIAAYEKTLETSSSAFDNYVNGNKKALTQQQLEGKALFIGKAKCFDCHFSPDFTGDEFKNIGLYNGADFSDIGRFAVTNDSTDIGKFKVPGLRNVAVTAPYMHNGVFKTLEDVVDYYDQPQKFVKNGINTDSLLQQPLNLNLQEKAAIVAFLKSLTDKQFIKQK